MTPLHNVVRRCAERRFTAQPGKCFQRHMRETWGRAINRPTIPSLDGARVRRISNATAAKIIDRYEWLGGMARGTVASYGLILNGELLGAVCFGKNASRQALRAICQDESKAICLVRGASVPWAPPNSATFLIRHACRLAAREFAWTHFLAYSDEQAGEAGHIYRACNWKSLGKAPQGPKKHFVSPDGRIRFSSYDFSKRSEWKFRALGWDGKQTRYDFLRRLGFTEHLEAVKLRWLWTDKAPTVVQI